MKKFLTAFLVVSVCFFSCDDKNSYDINNDEKYQKSKMSLEEIEKKNPEQFLSVSGNTKKNLMRQVVVKGKVFNNAKVVTFKDVAIKLKFYSKTGALLQEDTDVMYESIHPGGTHTFKSKYFAPKGTDSVALAIAGAKW